MGEKESKSIEKSAHDETAAPTGTEKQDALLAKLDRAQALAHIGDWEWDIASNAITWSDELYRIYGFEPGEVQPEYGFVLQQLHPSSKDEFLRAIDAALNENRHFEMDYRFYRKDGSEAVLHTIGKVIRDSEGSPLRMHGVVQDVTERKLVERRLKESEEKFRSIFGQAIDGILIADVETKLFVEANDIICSMLGYTREEILAIGVGDIHPKEDLPEVLKVFEQHQRGELAVAADLPVLRKDGSVFFADISANLFTFDGRPCLVGIFRDISERKQAEERMRESEAMLRQSQRVAGVGHYVFNTDAGTWESSVMLDKIFGIRLEYPRTVEGWLNLVHPEQRNEMSGYLGSHVLRDGKPFDKEYRVVRKSDGAERWVHGLGELEFGPEGNVARMFGTIQDITERKLADERIRGRDEYIRNILDTVDEGFIVVDRNYRILTANRAYCGQVDLHRDEVIGRHCYEISHQRNRPCYEEGEECTVRSVFETGKAHAAVHKHLDREGHVLFIETKAFPNKDRSGEVMSAIETLNNITERHLLEEERLKTQKLESIGTLAGGIAHDFNNLLQGVFGYISMARMRVDRKEESLAMLEQAEKALHRTVSLTNQLLTFAKGGKPVQEPCLILPVIENAASFSLSGSSSGYEIMPQDDLWLMNGDAGQIAQVIQNITLNADQSMPQGGTISITVNNVPADSEKPSALEKVDYVSISIRDKGVGIPEKFLGRIFDPYFTTKERGSGLGLATSYSIVRNHGGIIVVESRVGEGATFTVYLPAVKEKIRKPEPSTAPTEVRSAKVLVMDDEEIIREVTGNLLRALGHVCEFAEKGESAVAMFKAAQDEGRPFDLVLLDMTVRGGMGGVETIRELLAIDPEVKGIAASGYSNESILSDYRRNGFKVFLKKPYKLEELQAAINSLLG